MEQSIDYMGLKKALKGVMEAQGSAEYGAKKEAWMAELRKQFGRANEHFTMEVKRLDEKYKLLEGRLNDLDARARARAVGLSMLQDHTGASDEEDEPTEFSKLAAECAEYVTACKAIDDFARMNSAAFSHILKKFDGKLGKDQSEAMRRETEAAAIFQVKRPRVLEASLRMRLEHTSSTRGIRRTSAKDETKSEELGVVHGLRFADLAAEKRYHAWMPMYENALGEDVSLPVIVIRGSRPGPVLGITAAVHGNELNGVPLIHRLCAEIKPRDFAGTLVAVVVVNSPGYLAMQREFPDGQDLNRLFPGKEDSYSSNVFAARIVDRICSQFNYLLDLHTASLHRANSLYVRSDFESDVTAHMALLQAPQIVVHNTGPDGSLRGAMAHLGIPAITVEIGNPQIFQEHFIDKALAGVKNILSWLQMIPAIPQLAFDTIPTICSSSLWIFADCGGILEVTPSLNTWVRQGDVLATITDIFGSLKKEYCSPHDGIIIGSSTNPVCMTGDRILHLGRIGKSISNNTQDGHP